MHNIRISDATSHRLFKHAKSFDDTEDCIINRALDFMESQNISSAGNLPDLESKVKTNNENTNGKLSRIPAKTAISTSVAEKIEAITQKEYNTIQSLAAPLLSIIVSSDSNGETYGLTSDEILTIIKSKFPKSATTIKCLRWYRTKMKQNAPKFEGYKVPDKLGVVSTIM